MIDKSVSTLSEAIAGIHDGATIMIGGFGPAGQPTFLIDALIDQGARDLTRRVKSAAAIRTARKERGLHSISVHPESLEDR